MVVKKRGGGPEPRALPLNLPFFKYLALPCAGSKSANFEFINVGMPKSEFRTALTFLVLVRLLIITWINWRNVIFSIFWALWLMVLLSLLIRFSHLNGVKYDFWYQICLLYISVYKYSPSWHASWKQWRLYSNNGFNTFFTYFSSWKI